MQIMSLSVPIAPQTTGHPFGLPESRDHVRRDTRIEPVRAARDPDAGFKEGKTPQQFWRSANGSVDPSTHVAPPSIMQIKISQMLNEQAKPSRAEDVADGSEADKQERLVQTDRPTDETTADSQDPTKIVEDPGKRYAQAAQITQGASLDEGSERL